MHLSLIVPNEQQPRQYFDEVKLSELTASIADKGVLQPVLVRRMGDRYELIAGERRFRASKTLGLNTIPAIIKDSSTEESIELAIIENIQRDDLGLIEKAVAYQQYLDDYGVSPEELAAKLGIDRSSLSNNLRLLNLPQEIQKLVQEGEISFGHAKVLLSLKSLDEQKIW